MLKNEIVRLQQHEVSPISWSLETFLSNHLDLTRRLRSHNFLLLLREVRDSIVSNGRELTVRYVIQQ